MKAVKGKGRNKENRVKYIPYSILRCSVVVTLIRIAFKTIMPMSVNPKYVDETSLMVKKRRGEACAVMYEYCISFTSLNLISFSVHPQCTVECYHQKHTHKCAHF